MKKRPILHELHISDDPDAWRAVGFTVDDATCRIGTTTLQFLDDGAGAGIVAWSFIDVGQCDMDGIECRASTAPIGSPTTHPNGSVLVDHVVITTPNMDRTGRAFASVGLDLRRVRDIPASTPPRSQAFYRAGEVVLEVVGPTVEAGSGHAALWGLVTVVSDIDAVSETLGQNVGHPKDAVQPHRRIATVARSAGLSVPLAFISPDPRYHRSANSGL